MRKILRKFIDGNSLFHNILKMVLGTGFARLIGIATIPILTRLYSPDDYGILAVFTALVAVLAPVLTLRYVMAIPLPKTDELATNLLALSIFLLLFFSLCLGGFLYFFSNILLMWMSTPGLIKWWWLILLGSIAVAVYEMLSLWATRKRSYIIIAKTKVSQSFVGELTKIILGLLAVKPLGLLLGGVLEQSAGIFSFIYKFRSDLKSIKLNIRKKYLFLLIRYYRGFALFRLPSQFLLVFSMQAPVMFSAALYGANTTGQLGLALMAMALPISIIGSSVGQVFYGEIARLGKGSELKIKQLVSAVQKKMFLVGTPISLIIFLFGELIFKIVFGNNWEDAGKYASILAPYVLLQLTSTPLIQVLNVYNAQLSFLWINIFRTIGLIAIYFGCLYFKLSSINFVIILSIFLFIFYLMISLYINRMVNRAATYVD